MPVNNLFALDPSGNPIAVVVNADGTLPGGGGGGTVTVAGTSLNQADYAKTNSANSTAATFAAKVPTVTQPSGDGVLTWTGRENLLLLPYGTGADNSTLDVRVIGWQKIAGLWIPAFLCQATCTLSAIVGVAGQAVIATERFADTISVTNGIGVAGSPVSDSQAATLEVPVGPYDILEIIFDLGTATAANALYAAF